MNKTAATVLALIMLLVSVVHLTSYGGDAAPPKPKEVKSPGYPVMLGDQTIFYVKDVKGYPAEERAR